MTLSLRPPIAVDYDAIAAWIPNVKACLQWAGPRIQLPFTGAALQQQLAVADTESFTLTDGSPVTLGFGQLWLRDGDAARLMRIVVAPPLRGLGVGRELCRLLMVHAVDVIGARAVTLAVYRDNAAALALYESLGFTPVDSRSTPESLIMRLDLPSTHKHTELR
ncbi:MAG: N-acetyltransferase [Gammaproteobacteria bacterium]